MECDRILVSVNYYLPGYRAGGPIQSVANLCNVISEKKDICLVTTDRDSGMQDAYPEANGSEVTVGGIRVQYKNTSKITLMFWKNLIAKESPRVIYLNSLFNYKFTLLPIAAMLIYRKKCKVVIAPRGELYDAALAQKKTKKSIFLFLLKFVFKSLNVVFQATAEEERKTILKKFNKATVVVSENLPKKPFGFMKTGRRDGIVKLLFVSRIDRKKNLAGILNGLMYTKECVQFDCVGPVSDDEYWQECKKISEGLPSNIKFNYHGAVENSKLSEFYIDADYFVLLTKGENFGHCIYEALSFGLPVILSPFTIWGRDVEGRGAGYVIRGEENIGALIGKLVQLDFEEYEASCKSAYEIACGYHSNALNRLESTNLFSA